MPFVVRSWRHDPLSPATIGAVANAQHIAELHERSAFSMVDVEDRWSLSDGPRSDVERATERYSTLRNEPVENLHYIGSFQRLVFQLERMHASHPMAGEIIRKEACLCRKGLVRGPTGHQGRYACLDNPPLPVRAVRGPNKNEVPTFSVLVLLADLDVTSVDSMALPQSLHSTRDDRVYKHLIRREEMHR